MSEPAPGDPLDQNIARLLETSTEQPELPAEAEERVLSALKARQSQLYPRKGTAMPASVTLPTQRSETFTRDLWIGIVSLVGLAAAGLVATYLLQAPQSPSPGTPVVVQEPKSVTAEQVARETLADGTIVIARQGAKYSITAARQLTLDAGDLYLVVAPADEPFVVRTADGSVTAHGTRFAVSAIDGTSAAVAQGVVELAGDKGGVQLRAGQQGKLEKGKRPQRQPAPRLSHVVSWARDHLAQQEPLVETGEKKSGLIALDPWGQEVRLTLRKYDVDVVIEDGIARTTIDQTFFNHNPWNTEGTFYFPLPPDASVSRLAMYVFGDLNEGGMVERGYGQQVYNDIRYQRRDPALLEMMEGNVFKMRIFPLEGRQEKRVFLSYTQTLEELYGTLRYWFPMDHTHNVAKELSIRVRVKNGAGALEPHSATHEMETVHDGDDLVMTYSAENAKPDQDFLMTMLPFEDLPAARLSTTVKGKEQFLFARLNPEFSDEVKHEPRQWIVLNDASASRTTIEAQAQQYLINRLIEEADDDDTIAVVDINTRAIVRNRRFLSAKRVRRRGVGKDIVASENQRLLGATNLAAGLKQAEELIKQDKLKNPHVLYLGDGVATDGETEAAALVRMIPERCTFVGVGVGKKVEARFLQAAADATGGMFAVMNPDEDLDWRMFDLLAALNTPRLTGLDVSLETDGDQPLNVIAYPTSRVLSDGETLQVVARATDKLPTTLVVRGKLGDKPWQQKYDLRQATPKAEYIPRLWAKRHIDELLKSGDEFKDQIVELSKHYYVVTPLTSLIVLENDAMYQEYKVERGRSDHWALYPAPKKIEVVKEPVDWSRWGWWGGGWQGEDGKVEATTKPESVSDIVESVQFRINAPYYYWQPQAPGGDRYTLYQLADSDHDPSRMLTYLYIIASGKQIPPKPIPEGGQGASATPAGPAAGKPLDRREAMRLSVINRFAPGWIQDRQLGVAASSTRSPHFMKLRLDHAVGGKTFRPINLFFEDQLSGQLAMPLMVDGLARADNAKLRELSSFRRLPELRLLSRDTNGRGELRQLLVERKKLALPMSASWGTASDGYYTDFAIAPPLMQSYREAIGNRRSRIERDIRSFNQMYGQWDEFNWQNNWNTLDLRRSGNAHWYGGLEGFLTEEDSAELPEIIAAIQPLKESLEAAPIDLPRASTSGIVAFMPMMAERSRRRALRPAAQMAVYSHAMSALPGTCAVLAVDHLVPRRDTLRAEGEEKQQELELNDFAINSIDAASARLESSGPFWSWRGWDYKPLPASVRLPKVQAYPGYNWSFDLTRHAEGFYSSEFDIVNEIAAQYGTAEPRGTVAGEARSLVEAAREAIAPVRIRFGAESPELLAASGDRVSLTQSSEMYLSEQVVCDGEHLLSAYPELGMVARRKASDMRLSAVRELVPHFVQPIEILSASFDVAVRNSGEQAFTLSLTPVDQAADTEERIELRIKVGTDGLVRHKTLFVNGKRQFTLRFDYDGDAITMRWLDEDREEIAKTSFSAAPLNEEALAAKPFTVDLADQVVIDMPLRRPSYYADQLAQLEGKHSTDQFVRLKRHYALANIQQLQWRRWGQTNPEAQAALLEVIEVLNKSGRKALLGDITLLGSAGVYNVSQIVEGKTDVPATNPVVQYVQMRSSGWNNVSKLSEGHRESLVGHLAAYFAATQTDAGMRSLIEHYEESPLLLAAAYFRGSWGSDSAPMLQLVDNPRWRSMAILMASSNLSKPEQRSKWATAFKSWHDEFLEAGYDMAIPAQIVGQLKQHNDGKLWQEVIESKWQAVKEQPAAAPLLAFAEQAMSWGENERADTALKLFHERTAGDDSLLLKLSLAQALWAGGRPADALKLYEEMLVRLEEQGVAASPALLAASARLAQQSGNHGRAIELEEKALAVEHAHLPDMINLQAFRQRYSWLWQQYQAKVQEAANANNMEDLANWVARAEATWHRWQEVDRENPSMVQQMATLQTTAGRQAESWLYLSTLVDQKPKDANSYYHVGQWYIGQGQPETAQQYYATAFTWDTANPRWLNERAAVLKSMGREKEARELYQQVIDGKWSPGLQGFVNQAREALK